MNGLLSGIWFLDILNLIKYEDVDVFDSILNISTSTWWVLWIAVIIANIVVALLYSRK